MNYSTVLLTVFAVFVIVSVYFVFSLFGKKLNLDNVEKYLILLLFFIALVFALTIGG